MYLSSNVCRGGQTHKHASQAKLVMFVRRFLYVWPGLIKDYVDLIINDIWKVEVTKCDFSNNIVIHTIKHKTHDGLI